MEARLGADFPGVRVRTGDAAHGPAKAVGAHARTVGGNVVFQRDAYDPSSHAGRQPTVRTIRKRALPASIFR
ncbi:eCIS core domain-containing protein [Streptomyces sp. NPDC001443]